MDASRPAHPTSGYLPAHVPMTGTVGHSSRKVLIATLETPDRICGQALRAYKYRFFGEEGKRSGETSRSAMMKKLKDSSEAGESDVSSRSIIAMGK